MGTETTAPIILIIVSNRITVKLNNPLMGTETIDTHFTIDTC